MMIYSPMVQQQMQQMTPMPNAVSRIRVANSNGQASSQPTTPIGDGLYFIEPNHVSSNDHAAFYGTLPKRNIVHRRGPPPAPAGMVPFSPIKHHQMAMVPHTPHKQKPVAMVQTPSKQQQQAVNGVRRHHSVLERGHYAPGEIQAPANPYPSRVTFGNKAGQQQAPAVTTARNQYASLPHSHHSVPNFAPTSKYSGLYHQNSLERMTSRSKQVPEVQRQQSMPAVTKNLPKYVPVPQVPDITA